MSDIRVLIAEDQHLLRNSLATLLDTDPDITVVGQAVDGLDAIDKVRQLHPDIVLMDIRMPRMDGIAATAAILKGRDLTSPPRIIALTMFELDEYVFGALKAGAYGFLLKDTTPHDIIAAVKTVHRGHSLLAPAALNTMVRRFTPRPSAANTIKGLTNRQTEVLHLVARGLSNQQIEDHLCISHATLKSHMAALLSKLGARDRAQLVIAAYENGLMTSRP